MAAPRPARRAQCLSVAAHLPDRVVTNAELAQRVETSDEWIRSRTGIVERHIAADDEALAAVALPACQSALARAGITADELDGIIVGTITGDTIMPATANRLQAALGAARAWGFDVVNACNGFIAALATGTAMVESGRASTVLVVGGDVMSRLVDWDDRNTCILFGDGAGALVLRAGPPDGPGVGASFMASDGDHGALLAVPCSGSAMPATPERLAARQHLLKQDGRQVFQHAVRRMAEAASTVLALQGVTGDDVDLLVPHQANRRIIEPTARRLGMPMDRVVLNIDRVANTTGGTIPIALADAFADGRLRTGTRCLLVAFGGGFSWGAIYLTWGGA